ncbi:MAG TPA: hypothetical protein VJU86_20220 [Pyrinomonadaceae bacterium]|nr:hypothetical protein [Pyrinomonadaceae bacterium]
MLLGLATTLAIGFMLRGCIRSPPSLADEAYRQSDFRSSESKEKNEVDAAKKRPYYKPQGVGVRGWMGIELYEGFDTRRSGAVVFYE